MQFVGSICVSESSWPCVGDDDARFFYISGLVDQSSTPSMASLAMQGRVALLTRIRHFSTHTSSLTTAYSPPTRTRALSSLSQAVTSPTLNTETLPDWAGGDREILLYRNLENFEPIDIVRLSGKVFNAPVRTDLVHRVVHWQRAKRRAGTAKVKHRGEVRGSTKKVRPQKGTGSARLGDRRSPAIKGGGVVHGPTGEKIWDYPLPKNIRRQGLRSVLTSKYANGKLWIVDNVELSEIKTRIVRNALQTLKWESALVIDHQEVDKGEVEVDTEFQRASNNIRQVVIMAARGINVYDVLDFEMLVLTKAALQKIEKRFEEYDWFV